MNIIQQPRKIRIGNSTPLLWQIERKGEVEDLSKVLNLELYRYVGGVGRLGRKIPYELVDKNILCININFDIADRVGDYHLEVRYHLADPLLAPSDRACRVDKHAFSIVATTAEADPDGEFAITSDLLIGLQGDSSFDVWNKQNGGNNTYQDYFDFLQAPATEIEVVVSENETVRVENENTRISNEQTRVANEGNRFDAENDREENEDTRSVNEAIRITNEDDRIANENQRVIDETKRETLYDDVVILKDETEIATQKAISATNEVNDVVIPNAISATNEAKAQGLYAKNQGDYAKAEADKIPALIEGKADKVQEEWITPTLMNGATGTVKYRKNEFGVVEVIGNMSKNGANVCFALPIGYRPEYNYGAVLPKNNSWQNFRYCYASITNQGNFQAWNDDGQAIKIDMKFPTGVTI